MGLAPDPRTLNLDASGNERTEDPTIILKVDGLLYPVWADELSARDTSMLRQAVGCGFGGILMAMQAGTFDLDYVVAIMWTSRRQRGERKLTYQELEDGVTYKTEVEVVDVLPTDDEVDLSPEG